MAQRLFVVVASLTILAGCDLAYPEVVVVNKTAAPIQLRNLSFNGCAWDAVLAYGDLHIAADWTALLSTDSRDP